MILKMINIWKMNQIKHFIFLEIFYKSFSKFFKVLWDFYIAFKRSWNFHSYGQWENEYRSASTPKNYEKIKKIIEMENINTISRIFFLFSDFFVGLYSDFFFWSARLCFPQQKSTQFVLEQMVLVAWTT